MKKILQRLRSSQLDIKTELIAGITSFFAISYIIVVNPLILKDAGIPINLSIFATIFISIIGCAIMALWADAPVILTPGMGVNAFFTYTLVVGLHFTWQEALAVSIISSLLYLIIAFTPLSGLLARSIPHTLKAGITAGIGLFLVELGLEKANLIVAGKNGSLLALGNLQSPATLLALFGLAITLILYLKKIPGSFVIGIILTSLLAYFAGVKGQNVNVNLKQLHHFGQLFNQGDFSHLLNLSFWLAVFSMTMILVFESMGLLSGLLPDQNKFTKGFQSSALTAFLSGFMGTSPTVAAAESASGIESGGKTGLTALVASFLFAISLFVVGLLKFVPQAAIAPVIIITGALMMQQLATIDLHDLSEWFPAFLIIVLIPLTGSIATGLAFGFISYPIAKMAASKIKQISKTMWCLSLLFLIELVCTALLA
ncbi:NCS2 family permease [Bombilactobacillus thymidiniphilus]|uniref:NCS2 family permease n=1 Tax=Bombilactobacillus thymidiniphilus TaxID=2923363 RepID=A0ABY4PE16_9LACO|nr:NCS2 family permease [Bombilactobacillus thymidiniphilus]UQS83924.1 NCS2 family permease [Bombilactobacillus thymidiniphilus]